MYGALLVSLLFDDLCGHSYPSTSLSDLWMFMSLFNSSIHNSIAYAC